MKDRLARETSKVEHLRSQSGYPDLQLDYGNMVLCCPSAITGYYHCDTSKGNQDISFDLFSDAFTASLSYGTDGRLKCANEDHQGQIDRVLNLNNKQLMQNRRKAKLGVVQMMDRKGWKRSEIQKKLERWDSRDAQGR